MRNSLYALLSLGAAVLAGCADAPAATAPAAPLTAQAAASTRAVDFGTPSVIRFRSVEDPSVPADCSVAPFAANVTLGAYLYSEASNGSEGRVVNDGVRRIGTAVACARITTRTFPAELEQDFWVRFELADGPVTAKGSCTIVSNDVPTRGLVLAGCHLRVIDAPAGILGGAVASVSVFNPARLPGFNTGSQWMLHLYRG